MSSFSSSIRGRYRLLWALLNTDRAPESNRDVMRFLAPYADVHNTLKLHGADPEVARVACGYVWAPASHLLRDLTASILGHAMCFVIPLRPTWVRALPGLWPLSSTSC